MICAGIDFKINEKEWYPVLFGWVEKNFLRMDRNRFGVALSVSKEWDHQFVASLFASWRRFNTRGFNASLLVGPKVTADNIFDYDAWLQAYQASFYREPPQEPWERDSSEFGGWGMEPPPDEQDMENIADSTWDENYYPKYNVKWVGPYLRGKFSYKFRYNITAELNMNLFYGLVVDGPNSDYEKMNKFTGLWGPTFYWSPNIMTFYAGVENVFRRYFDIPDTYKNVLSDSMSLWEAKIGMKLDW